MNHKKRLPKGSLKFIVLVLVCNYTKETFTKF